MCGSASTVDQASMYRVGVAVRHSGGQTREAERGAFPRSLRCPRHRSYPPHGSRAYHVRPQLGLKSPPKNCRNWPQIGPSGPPKLASDRPLRSPRPPRAVLDPHGPHWDPPRRAQVGSKLAQVGPKSAPNRAQEATKRLRRGLLHRSGLEK